MGANFFYLKIAEYYVRPKAKQNNKKPPEGPSGRSGRFLLANG
jgi:hypothetical protein